MLLDQIYAWKIRGGGSVRGRGSLRENLGGDVLRSAKNASFFVVWTQASVRILSSRLWASFNSISQI